MYGAAVNAGKVTGVLLEQPLEQMVAMMQSHEVLVNAVSQAVARIQHA